MTISQPGGAGVPCRIGERGRRAVPPVRRILAVAVCLLAMQAAFGETSWGTSIVGVRTPDAVVIAADSLLTIRGGEKPVTEKACKIFRAGSAFFALTGFYRDPVRDFDISRLLPGLIDPRLPLVAAAGAASGGISQALHHELVRLRGEAPGAFGRYFHDTGKNIVRILFVGYENDQPVSLLQTYRYAVTPSGDIAVSSESVACPGGCDATTATFFFLTDRKPIDAYLATGDVGSMSPEEAARFFVDLVVRARTPDTGPPIDVVRIDMNGPVWITRKAECPDLGVPGERVRTQRQPAGSSAVETGTPRRTVAHPPDSGRQVL